MEKGLFDGISDAERGKMLSCFGAQYKSYQVEDVIADYSRGTNRVGILQSGKANLERVDINGNRTILESLQAGDVFGQDIAFGRTASDSLCVICAQDCTVLFINYKNITTTCANACEHHCTLIRNLFELMAQKVLVLSERVEVLSHRSIREKLLCCFGIIASREGSRLFDLPFDTFADLADYICTDRSAMMRELRNMKNAGLVRINGKQIELLNSED